MDGQERTEDIFEREWREAFDGVSQEPPRIVWSEIDRALAHDKALVYQKKSVYYRWMAAAIFLLATSIGLLQLAGERFGDGGNTIAEVEVDNPQQSTAEAFVVQIPKSRNDDVDREAVPPGKSANNLYTQSSGGGQNEKSGFGVVSNSPSAVDDRNEEHQVEVLIVGRKNLDLNGASAALVSNMERVPQYNYKYHSLDKKDTDEKRYWAGLDLGSGTFDPNFQGGASSLNSNLALSDNAFFSEANSDATARTSPAVRENMTSGQMMALGVNMGVKLSERWSVQGGVQYLQANATNNTNVVVATTRTVEKIAVTAQTSKFSAVQDVVSSEEIIEYEYQDVDLDNEFQFASIPIKAGYRVIDSKFSVQLNGGVAANLYLGNKLTDPSDDVATVTIGPGADSPYRELSFMGLAGVQFGYRLIDRFDIILEPNYRRALSDFTKSSSEFATSPSGFGVQTGIRYVFN